MTTQGKIEVEYEDDDIALIEAFDKLGWKRGDIIEWSIDEEGNLLVENINESE